MILPRDAPPGTRIGIAAFTSALTSALSREFGPRLTALLISRLKAYVKVRVRTQLAAELCVPRIRGPSLQCQKLNGRELRLMACGWHEDSARAHRSTTTLRTA